LHTGASPNAELRVDYETYPTLTPYRALGMVRTLTASSTEVLAGRVDRVIFHNSDNGFCVLRIKARGQRDLITLVGHAAMISAGKFVQASGSWVNAAPAPLPPQAPTRAAGFRRLA